MKTVNLLYTDSYFNTFPILVSKIKGKANTLTGRNLIFCEEKISLMAERHLCNDVSATFNTDVYSFGNYLRCVQNDKAILDKEGSIMAIKSIVDKSNLQCFSKSKQSLAPSLYDLIVQLKSAKVMPKHVKSALEKKDGSQNKDKIEGLLRNKLTDIYTIYNAYEKFLGNKYDDQSSVLSKLPPIIKEDKKMADTDVYLLGYTSWTNQAKEIISTLIEVAKSVTVILTGGKNEFLFTNETVKFLRSICRELKVKLTEEKFIPSEYNGEAKAIVDGIYNPITFKNYDKDENKIKTDKIFISPRAGIREEVRVIAETIKAKIIDERNNFRYRDFTVCVPDVNTYARDIKSIFNEMGIKYFIDKRENALLHPYPRLLIAYAKAFVKNFERRALSDFYKNPLFCEDKEFADRFENYLIKYNVNYSAIKKPFNRGTDNQEFERYQEFREKICSFLDYFNVDHLIEKLNIEGKLDEFSNRLEGMGKMVEAKVNDQVFGAVNRILSQMKTLLGESEVSTREFVKLFESGLLGLEISVLPQYSDAVFVGGFREVALAKAEYLFVVGLCDGVPPIKADVAMLTDSDLEKLDETIEKAEGDEGKIGPTIKVINRRAIENVGLALSSFNRALIVSYPLLSADGKATSKSEAVEYLERMFKTRKYEFSQEYMTVDQGLKNFAKACDDFACGRLNDFTEPSTFYLALEDKSTADAILDTANKKGGVEKINVGDASILGDIISPTTIEAFYECPYKAFLSKIIRLSERESGELDPSSIGVFMHDVFERFVRYVKNKTLDRAGVEKVVEDVVNELLKEDEYSRYNEDPIQEYALKNAVRECKSHCYNIYNSYANSDFVLKNSEIEFTVPLKGTKIKLYGKVDRIDESGEYCRIVDYKTGHCDESASSLYTGQKLQLFLYQKSLEAGRKIAGLYYLPITDEFTDSVEKKKVRAVGWTFNDPKVIDMLDKTVGTGDAKGFLPIDDKGKLDNLLDGDTLKAMTDYADEMCVKCVEQIGSGVIVSSPTDSACKYCSYKGMCDGEYYAKRCKPKVTPQDVKGIIDRKVKSENEGSEDGR